MLFHVHQELLDNTNSCTTRDSHINSYEFAGVCINNSVDLDTYNLELAMSVNRPNSIIYGHQNLLPSVLCSVVLTMTPPGSTSLKGVQVHNIVFQHKKSTAPKVYVQIRKAPAANDTLIQVLLFDTYDLLILGASILQRTFSSQSHCHP